MPPKKPDRIAFIFVRQMMILDVVATCNFEFSQLWTPPLLSLMAPPANWISNQSGEEEVPPLRLLGWHARHQSRPNFKVKKMDAPNLQSGLRSNLLEGLSLFLLSLGRRKSRAVANFAREVTRVTPRRSGATPVFRGIASARRRQVFALRGIYYFCLPRRPCRTHALLQPGQGRVDD